MVYRLCIVIIMAALRYISRQILHKTTSFETNTPLANQIFNRFLSFQPIEYSDEKDPAPAFLNNETQSILKTLTRIDMQKVFRHRKLGTKKLELPIQKFMTEDQLQDALRDSERKAEWLLQMPPVVKTRKPKDKILSKDPALEGYDTSTYVFTDITFGIKNADRLIVVRDPAGTLKEADWSVRDRVNQLYFPLKGKQLRCPKMFEDSNLESLLDRKEYLFILDRVCVQFEPDSTEYQKVTSLTYQYINENNAFEVLRSTRHFGPLVFFLAWNKMIDNLLLDLIQSAFIEEANNLLLLYSKLHDIKIEVKDLGDVSSVEEYIKTYSTKKAPLELAMQAYKELERERLQLEQGIKQAHGLA